MKPRTRPDRNGVERVLCTVVVGEQARAWRKANRRAYGSLGRPRTGIADDDPLCSNFANAHDLDGNPICGAHGPTREDIEKALARVPKPLGWDDVEGENPDLAAYSVTLAGASP